MYLKKIWIHISQATEESSMLSIMHKHSYAIPQEPILDMSIPTHHRRIRQRLICSLHFGAATQTPGLALIPTFPMRGKGIIEMHINMTVS